MKFCPECGTLLVTQKFCQECGANITKYLNNDKKSTTDNNFDSIDFLGLQSAATNQFVEQVGFEVQNGVLVKYTGKSRSVVIPKGITEIYDSAFEGNEALDSVVIGEDVTIIGKRAFYGCKCLKELVLPNSILEIYDEAFYDCQSLTQVSIPNQLTEIRTRTFCCCYALEKIILPSSLKKVGYSAFYGAKLKRIDVVNIEAWLNLDGSIIDANLVGPVFVDGNLLTELTIPNSIINIKKHAFYSWKQLKKCIIPDHVLSIGAGAFAACTDLKEVVLSKKISKIENAVFT